MQAPSDDGHSVFVFAKHLRSLFQDSKANIDKESDRETSDADVGMKALIVVENVQTHAQLTQTGKYQILVHSDVFHMSAYLTTTTTKLRCLTL